MLGVHRGEGSVLGVRCGVHKGEVAVCRGEKAFREAGVCTGDLPGVCKGDRPGVWKGDLPLKKIILI